MVGAGRGRGDGASGSCSSACTEVFEDGEEFAVKRVPPVSFACLVRDRAGDNWRDEPCDRAQRLGWGQRALVRCRSSAHVPVAESVTHLVSTGLKVSQRRTGRNSCLSFNPSFSNHHDSITYGERGEPMRDHDQSVDAFVVTFRRNSGLQRVLDSLAEQTRRPARILVVDNDSANDTRVMCESHQLSASLTYLAPRENEGPAGGAVRAMDWALAGATASWLLRIDDDRPLPSRTFLESLCERADRLVAIDPRTGAVGLDGASWDWRWCRLRVRPDRDPVAVDYLRTSHFPLYRLDMVREVGTFRADLFFGVTEVEYGLRIGRHGWTQWAVGQRPPAVQRGNRADRLTDWRRYYSIRNTVVVLEDYGRPVSAWRIGISRAVLRPLVELIRSPSSSFVGARLGLRALRDARARRMGQVIDPGTWNRDGAVGIGAEMPPT